jgi:hypothetical protein
MKKILGAIVAVPFFASPAFADDKAAPAKPAAAPAAAPSKEAK